MKYRGQLHKTIVYLLLLCLLSGAGIDNDTRQEKANAKKVSKAIKEGDSYFSENDFIKAVSAYKSVYSLDSNNIDLNYKIAQAYYYSLSKWKSYPYMLKVYMADSLYNSVLYYYMGRACQLSYNFSDAIKYYKKQENKIDELPVNEVVTIEKRIKECESGLELMKFPVQVKISNLGEKVNTEYPEYRPMVSENENILLFTSKREQSAGSMLDPFDNQYHEDIYIAKSNEGNWQESNMMDEPVNTPLNDAISGMSHDGKTLILYNDNSTDGDLYISNFEEGNWTVPERLPLSINSKYVESTTALSPSKDTLFFVSDRPDLSLGGKDIFYVVKNEKDRWESPINMGGKINTEFNEEAVSVNPGGNKLFFSSEGHNTMGGYDVFVSSKDKDGNWGEPVNLGYPINTTEDDLFFVMTGRNNKAYYSTFKEDSYGEEDIYSIIFEPEEIYAKKKMEESELIIPEIIDSVIIVEEELDNDTTILVLEVVDPEINEEEVSITDMYNGLQDDEVVDLVFETTTLDSSYKSQKYILNKAKEITTQLINENNNFNIEVLKRNPTKVIVEVQSVSSSKGLDFTYPSGGQGTFVMILPGTKYNVGMDIEDKETIIGKAVLVSSDVKKQLISNNIIAIDTDDKK